METILSDVQDNLDNAQFLLNSFTRPRYIKVRDALESLNEVSDQIWTNLDLDNTGNKGIIEPLFDGQIFQVSNFDVASRIYVRRPRTEDCKQFFISFTGLTGAVIKLVLLPLGNDVTILFPNNIGLLGTKRARLIWDNVETAWRVIQVRAV